MTINGRQYYDGGLCSPTNAQVAKGYDKVLVVHMTFALPNPAGGETVSPRRLPGGEGAAARLGSQVETIDPSGAVAEAIGGNP
jgi:predicted acylesterase/phospholipase RssA